MLFPLLGLTRDLRPLDNAHAEHTKTNNVQRLPLHIVYIDLCYWSKDFLKGADAPFIIRINEINYSADTK